MARRGSANARGQVFTTAAGTPTRRSHYAKTRAFCRIGPKKPRKIDDGILEVRRARASTALLHRCATTGASVVFLDYGGRFKGRLEGPVSGNVLLRRAQHEALSDPAKVLLIARHVVAGKVQNTRQVLLRGGREAAVPEDEPPLQEAARHLAESLPRVEAAPDLDTLRGVEGDAARAYFAVFFRLVKEDRDHVPLRGPVTPPAARPDERPAVVSVHLAPERLRGGG